MDNTVIDLSDQFSISFLNEDENQDKYLEQINVEKNRVKTLKQTILNFTEKLKSNPKADTIKWPDRIADIEKFEHQINEI